jgi:hypothetical protein
LEHPAAGFLMRERTKNKRTVFLTPAAEIQVERRSIPGVSDMFWAIVRHAAKCVCRVAIMEHRGIAGTVGMQQARKQQLQREAHEAAKFCQETPRVSWTLC